MLDFCFPGGDRARVAGRIAVPARRSEGNGRTTVEV
jgi:hypothetical protein